MSIILHLQSTKTNRTNMLANLNTKVISGLSLCALMCTQQLNAQVNLPATLTFTNNATALWSDGVAEDGDGGSSNINGITLQIFAATAGFSPLAGATMMWQDQTYFTGPSNFTGITPGPDPAMSNNGVPAMVIKSSSQAINFNLQSIRLYDWGGVSPVIATYNNGILVGSISPSLPTDGTAVVLSQPGALTPSLFQNIDEIRMYPQGGNPAFWIAMNNITLGSTPLPVSLTRFNATLQQDNKVKLSWETAMEQNSKDFTIEQSIDGINFKEAGSIAAMGNSNVTTKYSFVAQPIAQKSFFRLKQNDKDGQFVYSRITIAVPVNNNNGLAIYPNPATNQLHITSLNEFHEWNIYSLNGILVKTVTTKEKTAVINIADLPAGSYHVQGRGAIGTEHATFIKK
jgi:hypothetical protein